ncbi:MFS transporter [Janibacter sp. G1551]|uniref:MFS transporter n=1 Tax=Janibacter sp. G1551 TaxID=3420440 RepID=UPI003D048D6F
MTSTMDERASLRAFWAALPTEGRWLLSTVGIQTLGRGLTLPFTLIYINRIRGIDLDVAGLLMSLIFAAAFAVTGPGGSLVDRIGARLMVIAGTLSAIAGCLVMAFASTIWTIALACVLLGIANGVSWPAFNALISYVVTGRTRTQYFGINFALVNLGIGVGGLLGGLVVSVDRPATFTAAFVGNAVCLLAPLALMLGPLRHLHGRADRTGHEDAAPVSYRQILRHPAVAWVSGVTFLGAFVGYGQIEAGMPAFAHEIARVSTRVIGMSFALNTLIIVAFQFWMLRVIDGRRRTRVFMVMAAVWGLAWIIFGLSGLVPGGASAIAFVIVYGAVFGFGETMLQPTVPAIVNDLAPDHQRGRYNALSSASYQMGSIVGPVVAGVMLDRHLPGGFIAVLVVGCAVLALMALQLERHLTPEVNGLT